MKSKPTIGILGAGKLGTTLGRLFTKAGYPTLISNSRDVSTIKLTIEILVPNATPTNQIDLVQQADIIVLALPLSKYQTIPKEYLKDKIVVDAMNYWWEVDGTQRFPQDTQSTSSEMIQEYLSDSKVFKAFSHMSYNDLELDENYVMAYAGENSPEKDVIKELIQDTGFIPYDLGTLNQSQILEPGFPLFGANLHIKEFIHLYEMSKSDDSQ